MINIQNTISTNNPAQFNLKYNLAIIAIFFQLIYQNSLLLGLIKSVKATILAPTTTSTEQDVIRSHFNCIDSIVYVTLTLQVGLILSWIS